MNNKGTYTSIQDWMLDLPLDIWETVIYAVIWGFTMDGDSVFTGSRAYLARKARCSVDKVDKSTKHLVELGLINKTDKILNGVKYCEYKALPEAVFGGSRSQQGVAAPSGWGVVAPSDGGSRSERHNNIDDNIDIKKAATRTRVEASKKKFSFEESLVAAGATAQHVDALMEIRKEKRLTNTPKSYKQLIEAINTVCTRKGVTVDEVVAFMVVRKWGGLNSNWAALENLRSKAKRRGVTMSIDQLIEAELNANK